MAEFQIATLSGEPVHIVEGFPGNGNIRRLTGARLMSASGKFGRMLFQHFSGDGFDVWFSSYQVRERIKFKGGSDLAVLEFHSHYTNNFSTGWEGFGEQTMHHRQYQLTYSPFIETMGEFHAGKEYNTFDIHFYREILQPYVSYCPRLGKFLEQVERGKPARMIDLIIFLTPGMELAISEILSYQMYEELAPDFFKRRVHDLLVHMVYHLGSLDKAPEFDKEEILKAGEARKIILSDFSVYDSVEVLARKVGTSEPKLQLAFKHAFGVTVGKFSKDERMRKAHDLLLYTNEILLSIALMVGYNDAGNFSTAFKNHFGYSPGHVQKRMKRR